MAKYEKKMMQFEAFQYNGSLSFPACEKDYDETKHAPYWAALAGLKGILFFDVSNPAEKPKLYTRRPDGEAVHIPVGYYIIRWSDTELYPCEPGLFEASYKQALCEVKQKAYEIAMEYGYEPQSRQLIEEMAELIQAINKDWRKNRKYDDSESAALHPELAESHAHVVEELADVQIMIWQISYLIGAEADGELESAISEKIERQLKRIRERHARSGSDAK